MVHAAENEVNRAMLIDTDVLIWMTRGHAGAAQRLSQSMPWKLSAVTYIELAQGCRSKAELMRLKKGLEFARAEIIPLSAAISDAAMALIDAYALSSKLQLGDALIAATALEHGYGLLTGNGKHFTHLPGLKVERFVP